MIGFVERIGLALVAPRRAMALADEGQGGAPDLAWLLALKLVTVEARELVAAGWAALVTDPLLGLSAVGASLQAAIGFDLLAWLVGAAAITVLAGRRRAMGRDLDLAAVAWIPVVALGLTAQLVFSAARTEPPAAVRDALGVASLVLGVGLVLLAVAVARRRSPAEAA